MPKPCNRPLTPNPFETYRDPATGRWLVKYPAHTLPVKPLPVKADATCLISTSVEDDPLKCFPVGDSSPARRAWETPVRTRVA